MILKPESFEEYTKDLYMKFYYDFSKIDKQNYGPEIGATIYWNRPKASPLKPLLIINVWYWTISIGWGLES